MSKNLKEKSMEKFGGTVSLAGACVWDRGGLHR